MHRLSVSVAFVLGVVSVAFATFSTAAPVRLIPVTEKCPEGCMCLIKEDTKMLEVVCPTSLANDTPPKKDVNPSDVIDVETFIASSNKEETVQAKGEGMKEYDEGEKSREKEAVEDNELVDDVPLVLPQDAKQFIKPERLSVTTEANDADIESILKPDPVNDYEEMQGDEPQADYEEENDNKDDEKGEEDKAIEFEEIAPEPTAAPEQKITPSEVPELKLSQDDVEEDKLVEPTPSVDPILESITVAPVEPEVDLNLQLEEIAPSPKTAEITASLKPLGISVTSEPDIALTSDVEENKADSNESDEEESSVPSSSLPSEAPLVLIDSPPAPSSEPREVNEAATANVETIDSIEDILQPDSPSESPKASDTIPLLNAAMGSDDAENVDSPPAPNSTPREENLAAASATEPIESIEEILQPEKSEAGGAVVPKVLDDVESNQLDEVLTSEDLILGSEVEHSGKIQNEEAPGITEAPQQSTASWVILGLILAMFVGVLLYAAIKGRVESGHERPPKVPSVGSAVTVTNDFVKNRKPNNGIEGTEMKEMSRALLGSPLEDRCSRYIDEEADEEQIKRFMTVQEEADDEVLEQVVVESEEASPVNNAIEKPPRKFIHVPPPVVPGKEDVSVPNTPTLVRIKVVDSPEVRHLGNGNIE